VFVLLTFLLGFFLGAQKADYDNVIFSNKVAKSFIDICESSKDPCSILRMYVYSNLKSLDHYMTTFPYSIFANNRENNEMLIFLKNYLEDYELTPYDGFIE
jgi:hypothetical protein